MALQFVTETLAALGERPFGVVASQPGAAALLLMLPVGGLLIGGAVLAMRRRRRRESWRRLRFRRYFQP